MRPPRDSISYTSVLKTTPNLLTESKHFMMPMCSMCLEFDKQAQHHGTLYNPSTSKGESGASPIQSQPKLLSLEPTCLGYTMMFA